jgi:hypothetical protein
MTRINPSPRFQEGGPIARAQRERLECDNDEMGGRIEIPGRPIPDRTEPTTIDGAHPRVVDEPRVTPSQIDPVDEFFREGVSPTRTEPGRKSALTARDRVDQHYTTFATQLEKLRNTDFVAYARLKEVVDARVWEVKEDGMSPKFVWDKEEIAELYELPGNLLKLLPEIPDSFFDPNSSEDQWDRQVTMAIRKRIPDRGLETVQDYIRGEWHGLAGSHPDQFLRMYRALTGDFYIWSGIGEDFPQRMGWSHERLRNELGMSQVEIQKLEALLPSATVKSEREGDAVRRVTAKILLNDEIKDSLELGAVNYFSNLAEENPSAYRALQEIAREPGERDRSFFEQHGLRLYKGHGKNAPYTVTERGIAHESLDSLRRHPSLKGVDDRVAAIASAERETAEIEQRFPWLDRTKGYVAFVVYGDESQTGLTLGIQEASNSSIHKQEDIAQHVAGITFDQESGRWMVVEAGTAGQPASVESLEIFLELNEDSNRLDVVEAPGLTFEGLSGIAKESMYGDLDLLAMAVTHEDRVSDVNIDRLQEEMGDELPGWANFVIDSRQIGRQIEKNPWYRLGTLEDLNLLRKTVDWVSEKSLSAIDFPGEYCSELIVKASPALTRMVNTSSARASPSDIEEALMGQGGVARSMLKKPQ